MPPSPNVGSSLPAGVMRATTIGRPFAFAFEPPSRIAPSSWTAIDPAVPPTLAVAMPCLPKDLSRRPRFVSRSASIDPWP